MKHFSRRPTLEILEERTLLSTCHVTRLADGGGGSGMRGDLRYCINKVNDLPGPDTIDFKVTGTINLTGALPELGTDVDIVGPGAGALTVRRSTGGNYRLFTVTAGTTVRIIGLTVTNGYLSFGVGGGIHNQGTLALIDTQITHNAAGSACGIYNSGSLVIQNSTVSNNLTIGNQESALGGGIYSSGSLSITNSSIVGNKAEGSLAAWGGGISIAYPSSAMIQSSTIANNTAVTYGEPAKSYGGGIMSQGHLTITNSTISGNVAQAPSTGDSILPSGGGILSLLRLTIDNSTVANNEVIGKNKEGGGISAYGAGTVITHSTIAGNSYGGIDISSELTLRNSIVANNTGPDLFGTITNSGYNLIGNSSGGKGYVESDILDVNPKLGTLTNNGGPTQTMALLPGSPAIDSGDNHKAPEWDQRGPGFPRIVNGTIDRGAFEVQATGAPAMSRPSPASRADLFQLILLTADLDSLI